MRSILALIMLFPSLLFSQDLLINFHGDSKNEPILFLHGGPNGSSKLIELVFVDSLVTRGYFVITYDRRGEGRSKDSTAKVTYQEMIKDINDILDSAGVNKIILLSSSLGGYVGAKFASKHPEKVKMFIMADLGLNLKIATDSLLEELKQEYIAERDSIKIDHIEYLINKNLNNCYSWVTTNAFQMAMKFDLKKCEYKISPKIDSIRKQVLSNSDSNMASRPHKLWASNNNYYCEDLRDEIAHIMSNNIKMITIFGENDVLISKYEIEEMERLLGEENVIKIANGCHGVLLFRMEEALKPISKALPESR